MAHPSQSSRFATELRAELARRQISGSRLARLTGVMQSSMSRKLRGENEFTLDEVIAIARVLDMTTGELVSLADEPSVA